MAPILDPIAGRLSVVTVPADLAWALWIVAGWLGAHLETPGLVGGVLYQCKGSMVDRRDWAKTRLMPEVSMGGARGFGYRWEPSHGGVMQAGQIEVIQPPHICGEAPR